MKRIVPLLILIVLCAGCDTARPGQAPPPSYVPRIAVWSEFLSHREVESRLELLTRHHAALYLAIRSGDIGNPDLRRLLLLARERGVPVRAWLLLEDAEGYWPGEENLGAFKALVERFRRWNRQEGFGISWLIVDMEPPLETSRQLFDAFAGGDLVALLPVLLQHRNPEAFETSRRRWAEAVTLWKRQGFRVMVVTFPLILDDFSDDDATIQDVLQIPIEGIEWDEVSLMLYQNLFSGFADQRLGPRLIYDYMRSAVERFGSRASVALGLIGTVGKSGSETAGYETPDQLTADLAAALAAGVTRFQLFSLDGMLQSGSPDRWFEALRDTPIIPPANTNVDELRRLIRTLDSAW